MCNPGLPIGKGEILDLCPRISNVCFTYMKPLLFGRSNLSDRAHGFEGKGYQVRCLRTKSDRVEMRGRRLCRLKSRGLPEEAFSKVSVSRRRETIF